MSKGSARRIEDVERIHANWDTIFSKRTKGEFQHTWEIYARLSGMGIDQYKCKKCSKTITVAHGTPIYELPKDECPE